MLISRFFKYVLMLSITSFLFVECNNRPPNYSVELKSVIIRENSHGLNYPLFLLEMNNKTNSRVIIKSEFPKSILRINEKEWELDYWDSDSLEVLKEGNIMFYVSPWKARIPDEIDQLNLILKNDNNFKLYLIDKYDNTVEVKRSADFSIGNSRVL
jgi:hypothetical protein